MSYYFSLQPPPLSPWPDAAWTCSWFPVSGPGCRCVLLRETKGYYGFIVQISGVRVHRVHMQGKFLARFRCQQQGGGKPIERSNVLTSCFIDYICVLMMKVLSATLLQTNCFVFALMLPWITFNIPKVLYSGKRFFRLLKCWHTKKKKSLFNIYIYIYITERFSR